MAPSNANITTALRILLAGGVGLSDTAQLEFFRASLTDLQFLVGKKQSNNLAENKPSPGNSEDDGLK